MKKNEVIEVLEQLLPYTEEEDRKYVEDLIRRVKAGKRIENPDDYADLLIGLAAEADEELEEKVYEVSEYILGE